MTISHCVEGTEGCVCATVVNRIQAWVPDRVRTETRTHARTHTHTPLNLATAIALHTLKPVGQVSARVTHLLGRC